MQDPFSRLPDQAFWRPAVAEAGPFHLPGLIAPRFPLTRDTRVATAGSCFAQHVGRALRGAGLSVLDTEPAPPGLSPDQARRFGFGLYSARYGNIYTTRQFRQLLEDTRKARIRPEAIWTRAGGHVDALRPGVEPEPLASEAEVIRLRQFHLGRVKRLLSQAQVFIFTLGLTETWEDAETGTVFPTAPGVLAQPPAGREVRFLNLSLLQVLDDLASIRKLLHRFNPEMRLLLTVSPVPLTATASGSHVLAANAASKAILRAAVQDFIGTHPDADYVPSYEIITNPAARGRFHEPNLRSVTAEGVDLVMSSFLAAHGLAPQAAPDAAPAAPPQPLTTEAEALICEEALLEAFRP